MEIGLEIKRISHFIKRRLELSSDPEICRELTWPQMEVILFIKGQEDDVYQKDIERHFDVNRSSVSLMLSNMQNKGLISRERIKSDARLNKIILTEKSVKLLNAMKNQMTEVEAIISKGITQQEAETMLRVFDKIRDNLNGEMQDGCKQKRNI